MESAPKIESRPALEMVGIARCAPSRRHCAETPLEEMQTMLRHVDATANLAVKDLKRARKFYEETLGLEPVASEGDDLIVYRSGQTNLNVYVSDTAGTNQSTAVTWAVGDRVRATVKALADKGVVFEHYDMPDTVREGDVHVSGDMEVAWFKDPDGNILNIASR